MRDGRWLLTRDAQLVPLEGARDAEAPLARRRFARLLASRPGPDRIPGLRRPKEK